MNYYWIKIKNLITIAAMEAYSSRQEYIRDLVRRAELPEGFRAATTSTCFFPREIPVKNSYTMNLSIINVEQPTDSFAAVFTRNSFPGAPVIIGKKRLKENSIKGVFINNKISNVCAPQGVDDAELILNALAEQTGDTAEHFFCASTGVIGWKLPVDQIIEKLPALVAELAHSSLLPIAEAIMTTDAYPKIREERLGQGKIVGIAKGAGMIEPNMATMLVFLLTDIQMERQELQEALHWATSNSFNKISIDSDQSTSDMALILSSNLVPLTSSKEFKAALLQVCQKLAEDIVRNGEGVNHVIKVTSKNAPSQEIAAGIGKAICNSNLVKTAIFGNDPNVGRIISAVGDYLGNNSITLDRSKLTVSLGGTAIFEKGTLCLDAGKEKLLTAYLADRSFSNVKGYPPHDKLVDLVVDLKSGTESASVIGADLSYDYVKENASYRS
ncbi:MAG: bifunctional glutamate N-acetyltransferase/amino-acid acetyltransferase ArgJ [Spirochaetales bacterium]|nr:bifunctional glutamate N-acetyltransferase/amino-acid acetyltransferase ArgJ [Spirochaetales bacterium]